MAALAKLFIVFCIFPLSYLRGAEDSEIVEGDSGAELDRFLTIAQDKHGFSGAVLVAVRGQVVLAKGYGLVGKDGSEPLTSSTLFELGSTTKAITATAIFRLQELGELRVDDPISMHLPIIPKNCQSITIRHLLQHTSGIPPTNPNGEGKDIEKVIPLALAGGPRTEPGKVSAYWNGGYMLLSEIIARASGSSYEEFCVDSVFSKCGMAATRFTGHPAPDGYSVSIGRSEELPDRGALEHPYGEYGFQYRGMGGAVSNVWDMWRLDRALSTEALLSKETVQEMISRPIGGYSPGWQIQQWSDGSLIHGHSGSVRGFLSEFRRYPHIDGCLVIQSNRLSDQAKWTMKSVTKGCEQVLTSQTIRSPFYKQIDSTTLTAMKGAFVNKEIGRLEVLDRSVVKAVWKTGATSFGLLMLDDSDQLQLVDQTEENAPLISIKNEQGNNEFLELAGKRFKREELK